MRVIEALTVNVVSTMTPSSANEAVYPKKDSCVLDNAKYDHTGFMPMSKTVMKRSSGESDEIEILTPSDMSANGADARRGEFPVA